MNLSNQHPLAPETEDTQTMTLMERLVAVNDETGDRTFEATVWIDGREFRLQRIARWSYHLIPVVGHS